MSKEVKIEDVLSQKLVLVHDPILGSRYELQTDVTEVEIKVESIDVVDAVTEILSSELDKAIKNEQ